MVKMSSFLGMSLGAFIFWETMDKVHVWIALHQDEKLDSSIWNVNTGGGLIRILSESCIWEHSKLKEEAEVRKTRPDTKEQDSLA
ncbi:hypothetical protein Leryth_002263 [Lithospermum erythrorhizon]|nr:hypothetical protein Leryth_002263 [Lithospermum erythrorhizon]